MNSRERLNLTLNHKEPEKVVVDLGSTLVTGISAVALHKLKKALGLSEDLVKINDPFQMLGDVEEDVRKALKIDVVGVTSPYTMFGYKNDNWKEWNFKGINVHVGENFNTTVDSNGDIFVYPKGDISAKPSARMPKGGFYFDNIVRQEEVDEDNLNGREDFKEDFSLYTEEIIKDIKEKVDFYYDKTEYGINLGSFLCSAGDFAPLPGPGVKEPKGIRNVEDWLVAHYTHPEYIKDVYELQTEIAIENLKKLKDAVGNKGQVIQISGTDFGTQRCELISPELYREFYKPYHKRVNDWVHENTNWKTFYHCCGSILRLLQDFHEAGMDILNPVQCSAEGMDPEYLKKNYGDKFVFWGGGVNTQKTLPFGTPQDVKEEVKKRLEILSKGGGFVFNPIHNIQANTPINNIIAMFEAIEEFNK